MDTLIDFFGFTKGQEYVIGVLFLFLFISFWRFLNGGKG
jgi:hypothetical protein